MRAFIILLATLLLTSLATPNYKKPQKSDLNSPECTDSSTDQSFVKSPIAFVDTQCASYDSFKLSMADITGVAPQEDGQRGSFIVNYNGAKLQVNNESYTSRILTFRHQSEHRLPQRGDDQGRRDLEMQIEFDNDKSGKPPAVLSFLVQDIGEDPNDVKKMEQYRLFKRSRVVESLDPKGWVINLDQLAQQLMAKSSKDEWLNMYTYPGTLTYSPCEKAIWFVHGNEIYAETKSINAFRDLAKTAKKFTPGSSPDVNAKPVLATVDSSNAPVQKLCYQDFFEVTIGQTYGMWFGVATILILFIMTLWLNEKPIKSSRYQTNVWTHHPIYSVKFTGNDIHTRKSRVMLILILISLNAMFSAIFYNKSNNRTRTSNIIVYAIYSSLLSFVITFLVGNVLRMYYEAKYQFFQTKEESWDQKAQNRLFAFYSILFTIVVVTWPVCVWMMNGLQEEVDATSSNLWVASFFVGIGLELLVYYPLECLLASKSEGFKNLAKKRGFMYDDVCHETYLAYAKSL